MLKKFRNISIIVLLILSLFGCSSKVEEYESAKKIVIDTDTAADDAIAMILALKSKKTEVLGITTVFGNISIEQATKNALMTVEITGSNVEVYKGAATAITGESTQTQNIFGDDGMGDCGLIHPSRKENEKSAVDFILETVKANPNEVEIVSLGPSTNIAEAILKDGETMKKVKHIYAMATAGIETAGNATPVAEFNVYKDPDAFSTLLNSGIPLTILGLDATKEDETNYYEKDLNNLAKLNEVGDYICKCSHKLADLKKNTTGKYFIDFIDPITMACAIWNDYILEENEYWAVCVADDDQWGYGEVIYFDVNKHYDTSYNVKGEVEPNCSLIKDHNKKVFKDRIYEIVKR